MATFNLRDEFRKSFEVYRNEALAKSLVRDQVTRAAAMRAQAGARLGPPVAYQGTIQQALRPLFAKGPARVPTFADHPDYEHLRGTTNTEKGAITTLFMDLEGSTRLGILYPPETVYLIKNLFICAAIEIINAYDGHVHRIMGDAVMAYFGSKTTTPSSGAVDAVNCASVLRYFVESTVIPMLKADGYDDPPFGIRLGVDHAPRDKVLWSSYGYPGQEEVTATSFFVDVASKLQHAASRNQIMLGQSIRDLLDLPDELLAVPTRRGEKGAEEPDYYIRPNYTDRQGKKLNYRKHILDWERYLRLTPLAPLDAERFMPGQKNPSAFSLAMSFHAEKEGALEREAAPAAVPVMKQKAIRFTLTQNTPFAGDCTTTFSVENNGAEAAQVANRGNHVTAVKLAARLGGRFAVNWEDTAYRGLHYMKVDVRDARANLVYSRRVGVYVE